MTPRRLSLLLAVLWFSVSGISAENWGHYQHDNAHTGQGFSLGFDPLGAWVSRSAVINTYDGQWRIDPYHEN